MNKKDDNIKDKHSNMQINMKIHTDKQLAKANALRSNLKKRKLQKTHRKLAMDTMVQSDIQE